MMKPRSIVNAVTAVILVNILLAPSVALSASISIGTDVLEVPIPKGYCELSAGNPSDSRLIGYLNDGNSGVNEVLLVIANCDQLTSWRQGVLPTLNDYGYVLSPSSMTTKNLKMPISSFHSQMKKVLKEQGLEIMDDAIGNAEKTISKHFSEVKLNETKNLGIVAQDDYAVYLAILQNLKTEQGEDKNLLGVYGMTLIEGKIVNLYLWKNYINEQTSELLELLTSTWVSNLHQAN